jgi:hypothetical protein
MLLALLQLRALSQDGRASLASSEVLATTTGRQAAASQGGPDNEEEEEENKGDGTSVMSAP